MKYIAFGLQKNASWLLLAACALTATGMGAFPFPLPSPTLPTSFPLSRPSTIGLTVAWGYNVNGETKLPAGLDAVVAIAGGWNHTAALKADGSVVSWGYDQYGQTDPPPGLDGVVALAAGANHT
ncbi:MAG TPA: RCC1 domain-containing protein, partial [Candidatus Limnocylindria bacterium]|nr:RCC1 domain-containing protein [Candidatus Limnocylindria bacterium]